MAVYGMDFQVNLNVLYTYPMIHCWRMQSAWSDDQLYTPIPFPPNAYGRSLGHVSVGLDTNCRVQTQNWWYHIWNRFGIPAQFKNDAHLDVWDPNHRMLRDGCAGIPNLSLIFVCHNLLFSVKILFPGLQKCLKSEQKTIVFMQSCRENVHGTNLRWEKLHYGMWKIFSQFPAEQSL